MAREEKQTIGQLLIEAGVISTAQLDEALEQQQQTAERIGQILVRNNFANQKQILNALEMQLGIPYLNLKEAKINPDVLKLVPVNFVYEHKVMPVKLDGRVLTLAVADPLNVHTLDDVRLLLGYEVEPVMSAPQDIADAIRKHYGIGATSLSRTPAPQAETRSAGARAREGQEGEGAEDMASDTSVVNFVSEILQDAHSSRATDIHAEPFGEEFRIRYRIDGVLSKTSIPSLDKRFRQAIISRIKVMADLNIAEKRLPQDGRTKVNLDGDDVDLRISLVPTIHGETLDIRLLSQKTMLVGLEELGLLPDSYERLNALIDRTHGIILLTGPTGCGKTTTLYSALARLNSEDRKIITIEDPVEYEMAGVSQIQFAPKIDLTFARGLRSVLRHDPDIILVGEIRDRETADIAIRSALTGHLVFSTLHTNDASGAITRLADMGIEPFLLASSIEGIVAQRLVRRICQKCKEEKQLDPETVKKISLPAGKGGSMTVFQGKGCDDCRETGYFGRLAIFEIMVMEESIRELVLARSPVDAIRQRGRTGGMRTLRESGWRRVMDGTTTVAEVLRVTGDTGIGDG